MSLIEVMIAMLILIVGALAIMGLVITAIQTNRVNRHQSNSTAVAQLIMENIMSVPANQSPTLTLTDCLNPAQNINTAGAASPNGAGATLLSGDIDFSQVQSAVPAGYAVLYTTCGSAGRQMTYDVRWNVQTLSANTKLITVSARQMNANANDRTAFAAPVTIRSLAGLGS